MTDYTHFIKILPKYSISFWHYTGLKKGRCNSGHMSAKKHKGLMSKKAKSRLHNCMYWLLLISNRKKVFSKKENMNFYFKINFITLTLSSKQKHTDQFIKNHMLAPFLKFLKRSWNCNSYIWKAEAQKNGNIHFHITANKFVHHRAIRNKWNSLQYKHGYIESNTLSAGKKFPNSTDVHAVKNETQIIKYMLKYFSKSEPDKRPIEGKLWDASENLNQSAIILNDTNGTYSSLLSTLETPALCDKKMNDFHTLYLYKRKIFPYLPISIRTQFNETVETIRKQDKPVFQYTIESIY